MATPKYCDFGKTASSLFNDDFPTNFHKLTLKTTSANGVNFKIDGTRSSPKGDVSAVLEAKYDLKNGLSIKEKWSSANVVSTEVTIPDIYRGAKATTSFVFSPSSGFQSAKVDAEYKTDACYTDASVNFPLDGKAPTFAAASAFSWRQYVFGASFAQTGDRRDHSIGVQMAENDLVISSRISNLSDVSGSIHHVKNADLQTAVGFSWNQSTQATDFRVGAKMKLDGSSSAKVKLDKGLNLGLSYTTAVNSNLSVTFGALINLGQLNSGAHSVGAHFTLDG